jgi:hypothetical protein
MVASRCLDAANFPFIDPLFDRWETDAKLLRGASTALHSPLPLVEVGAFWAFGPECYRRKAASVNPPGRPLLPAKSRPELSITKSDSTSEPSVIYTSSILEITLLVERK